MKFPEVQGIQKRKSMDSKEISFLSWHFILERCINKQNRFYQIYPQKT